VCSPIVVPGTETGRVPDRSFSQRGTRRQMDGNIISQWEPGNRQTTEYATFTGGPARPDKYPIRLEEWRLDRGMTQRDLAQRSGLAFSRVNEIETGKRTARPSTLRRLAATLDVEDWELHNYPREEYAFAPQVGRAVDRLWRVFNTLVIGGVSGRDFAHHYQHW